VKPAIRYLAGALLGFAASACSPLKIFNTVVPKDGDAVLIARDLAFGADPLQRVDLYGPVRRGPMPLPVIVFFYGGSWNSGTKAGYAFVGRALAARGFVVAIPDYRLVPRIRYPIFLEDNAAAVRWVRANVARYGGDPDRLVLAGHSAGAYNAAMLALDPRWLGKDRTAVRGLIGLAGPYDFLPFAGPVVQAAFGGAADPASTQPVNYASDDDPPAFLATGGKDVVVLPRNSDALAMRLRAHNVKVVRKQYNAVGHAGLVTAIAKPFRSRAAILDDAATFAAGVTR
jgi:acetyl esterase/lipase